MVICVACLTDLTNATCTGECTLYQSSDYHVLCEPCFLDEDETLFEMAGTNDLPELLDIYDNARIRKRNGEGGELPSQLYTRLQLGVAKR